MRRALAKFSREIYSGALDYKQGHCLVIAMGTLAKIMEQEAQHAVIARLDRLDKANAPSVAHPPH